MKTITKFIYTAFASVTLAIGAVTAQGAVGDLFASINGPTDCGFDQNFAGAIFHYNPTGVLKGRSGGLSRPRGLAFDSVGNLFVATTCFDDGCPFQAEEEKEGLAAKCERPKHLIQQ
jgi:hypothetical protein